MQDHYGNPITAGSKLRLLVGIPGRDVFVTVRKKRGRLVGANDEGDMPVSEILQFFPTEVITT